MKFDLNLYSDGRHSQYGNCKDLEIDELVDELIYYDYFNSRYEEDELFELLKNKSDGSTMYGTRWFEWRITKKQ